MTLDIARRHSLGLENVHDGRNTPPDELALKHEQGKGPLGNVVVLKEVSPKHVPPRSARARARSRARSAAEVATVKAPQPARLSPHEISRFACNVLEMTHAFREFNSMHKDPELLMGFLSNKHIDDPRYSKMQRAFNSLQDRATLHGPRDSRISELFFQMVQKLTSDPDAEAISSGMEGIIDDMVGMENIVSAGPFKKFGVICVKDTALPDPRPENLVTASELREMKMLRDKLRFPSLFNKIKIQGTPEFTRKTLESFEKMLCYPEGREIVTRIYAMKSSIKIRFGKESECIHETSTVTIIHKDLWLIGSSEGKAFSYLRPSWITLGHELIHALHHASGYRKMAEQRVAAMVAEVRGQLDTRWTNAEEYVTIGDPEHPHPLSENGLLTHTMHPLRIYHAPGSQITAPLVSKIKKANILELDGDIEILLKENPEMPIAALKEISTGSAVEKFAQLKMLLLDHPRRAEFLSKDVLHNFLTSSLENGHEDIIERILLEHPNLINSLKENELTSLLTTTMQHAPDLLSRFLNDPNIRIETLQKISICEAARRSPILKMAILTHPRRAEFINDELLYRYLIVSLERRDKSVINRILTDHSELLDKINPRQKRELLCEAVVHSQSVYTKLVSKGFLHEFSKRSYFKDLASAVKTRNLPLINALINLNGRLKFKLIDFQPAVNMAFQINDPTLITAFSQFL